MKDELNGLTITRGYFLGIKKYGYIYKDLEGNKIEKSVIAGVKRDSVNFFLKMWKTFSTEKLILKK
jgi:hypothetical protein